MGSHQCSFQLNDFMIVSDIWHNLFKTAPGYRILMAAQELIDSVNNALVLPQNCPAANSFIWVNKSQWEHVGDKCNYLTYTHSKIYLTVCTQQLKSWNANQSN